jgi:predicted transcriptional regulator
MKKRAVARRDFEWLMEAVKERTHKYPKQAFNELFRYMDKIERKYGLQYRLTKSERAALDESLRDARRGRFATAKEVAEVFKRFRGAERR